MMEQFLMTQKINFYLFVKLFFIQVFEIFLLVVNYIIQFYNLERHVNLFSLTCLANKCNLKICTSLLVLRDLFPEECHLSGLNTSISESRPAMPSE